jgi:hypothetical protein
MQKQRRVEGKGLSSEIVVFGMQLVRSLWLPAPPTLPGLYGDGRYAAFTVFLDVRQHQLCYGTMH